MVAISNLTTRCHYFVFFTVPLTDEKVYSTTFKLRNAHREKTESFMFVCRVSIPAITRVVRHVCSLLASFSANKPTDFH